MNDNKHNLNKRQILEMVKGGQITAKQGAQLIKKLQDNQVRNIKQPEQQGKPTSPVQDIAVIGMSGRFPASETLDEFWNNLAKGIDCIREIPQERWHLCDYYDLDPQMPESIYCKWAGLLSDIDRFDPLFFNISPKEAELMDPRQRLFLQEGWKALEDAGYSDKDLQEKMCGVFVGCQEGYYLSSLDRPGKNLANANAFIGNSNAILAARISYFLNMKGPSLAIDTACSSSLAAVHLACESLRTGAGEMAIAGGVSMISSPTMIMSLGQAGMLSPTGRCRTFDNNADGFVLAEGVGAVILKPLAAAREDRDHIYGVIKGSGINQDGKTNSITAPSAPSQTALECAIYNKYNIHPETIGYVEAHGTGTRLGDPIEIQALTDAFARYTDKTRYCPIGSVKSNIGHPAAAAGIASLIKVLCCLKYKKLVPSINFEKENEHINFKETPFYVIKEFKDWPTAPNTLRCAVISSFGFSGTNSHLVLEESPVEESREQAHSPSKPYFLVPLSAKTPEALEQKMKSLAGWLKRESPFHSVNDVAYTLLAGRSHFPVRSALVVKNLRDLEQKITSLLDCAQVEDYFFNQTEQQSTQSSLVFKEVGARLIEQLKQALAPAQYKERLLGLADLYTQGIDPDWKSLYEKGEAHRIPLPTYPFARESYWIAGMEKQHPDPGIPRLHPLIQRNISTLQEEKFVTRLSGDEFYLEHHVINDRCVLPGVVIIEMARAAGELAGEKPVRQLRDITWLRPIMPDKKPKEIYISLYPCSPPGMVEFKVSSIGENSQGVTHAQGKLSSDPPKKTGQPHEPVDIDKIKQRCSKKVEGATCYKRQRELGLHLGHGFQVIRELYAGETEILSLLRLPKSLKKEFDDYTLHPSLMDGTLHSFIGFAMNTPGNDENTSALYIPFSMGEVEILDSIPETCAAHIMMQDSSPNTSQKNWKYNARIMDENGNIVVKITDLLVRPVQLPSPTPAAGEKTAVMTFRGAWKRLDLPQGLSPDAQPGQQLPGVILLLDHQHDLFTALKKQLRQKYGTSDTNARIILVKPGTQYQKLGDGIYQVKPGRKKDIQDLVTTLERTSQFPTRIIHHWSQGGYPGNENDTGDRLYESLFSLFHLARVLLHRDFQDKSSIQALYIHSEDEYGPQPLYAAVNGFAKTLHLETDRFTMKTVKISSPAAEMAGLVLKELQVGMENGMEIVYRDGQRQVKEWHEFDLEKETKHHYNINLKQKGVYVITGGLGGLGMIFARYLASGFKARLVLVGRSDLSPKGTAKIRELEALGAEAIYIKADVSVYQEVKLVIRETKSRFHAVDGIIHSAGLVRDALFQEKKQKDIKAVLAPKVYGTINLDEASIEEDLDIFVLFSSVAAVTGNAGQCDYTYANSFMDHFAERRENLRQKKKRQGKTLSINWPLWQEGGLKVDQTTGTFMAETLGFQPLKTETGVNIFAQAMAAHEHQVMLLAGDPGKIRQIIKQTQYLVKPGHDPLPKPEPQPLHPHGIEPGSVKETGIPGIPKDELFRRIQRDVTKLAAEISKVKEERFYADKNLSEYGFDSLNFVEFSNQINRRYSLDLKPALFFEYPSITSLSRYLFKDYGKDFIRYYGESTGTASSTGTTAAGVPDRLDRDHENVIIEKPARTRFQPLAVVPGSREEQAGFFQNHTESIAIIGMNGVMPQSDNPESFWNHLEQGDDLITRVPEERWKWGAFEKALTSEPGMPRAIWGGFMNSIDRFDPLFFGISPREAEVMDPQQRIFLETVWRTIEDAGYRVSELSGTKTGIFVGVSSSDFSELLKEYDITIEGHSSTGMAHSVLANRISYLFNFHGPSEPIDTACSSSLTAVHRAVESIRSGDCHMAIAGGVSVLLSPTIFISFIKAGMLSPDGRCKTFDKRANGYVRGEGSGAVLLKPLSRAQADGDHIYAVIKSTAVNHGGHASSLTAPNPIAQADLLVEAYKKTGFDFDTVTYIETHGTGTSLGDPVEINGLKRAFSELARKSSRPPGQSTKKYCGLGSVKTNIGHLEAAAGIAGLIKVLLAMKHKKLPGNVHFQELNPYIQLEDSPFYILRETRPWQELSDDSNHPVPRRAGISSFGFGGANAHIVLEEHQPLIPPHTNPPPQPHIFVLSARDEERLKTYALEMVKFLENIEKSETSSSSSPGTAAVQSQHNQEKLLEKIQQDTTRWISRLTAVEKQYILPGENISEYGLDPIQLSGLMQRINQQYDLEISKDIFTRHLSLNKLSALVLASLPDNPDKDRRLGPVTRPLPKSSAGTHNLSDIAYTLQLGRDSMKERLAVIAAGISQLKEKLIQFCQSRQKNGNEGTGNEEDLAVENIFRGKQAEMDFLSGFLLDGNEGREYLDIIIRERKLEKLARLWVSGVKIHWKLLYEYHGLSPHRLSLPTYPLARERYWFAMDKPGKVMEIPAPVHTQEEPGNGEVKKKSLREVLAAAGPGERGQLLESYLTEEISRLLRLGPTQKPGPQQPLIDMGLDSLIALQLKQHLETELEQEVSMVKFLGGESVRDLARLILPMLGGEKAAPMTGPTDDYLQNDLMEGIL